MWARDFPCSDDLVSLVQKVNPTTTFPNPFALAIELAILRQEYLSTPFPQVPPGSTLGLAKTQHQLQVPVDLTFQQPRSAHDIAELHQELASKSPAAGLNRWQLESELPYLVFKPDLHILVRRVLDASVKQWDRQADRFENAKGLRFWQNLEDGTRRLIHEWVQLFDLCEHYLMIAPFDVQEMYAAIKATDARASHQASDATFDGLPDLEKAARKREKRDSRIKGTAGNNIAASQRTSHGMPKRKRADTTVMAETDETANSDSAIQHHDRRHQNSIADARHNFVAALQSDTKNKDTAEEQTPKKNKSKTHYRWSQGRLRVWREILRRPDAELPDSALRELVNELESTSTAASTNIRLCNYTLSIEEILSFFPQHSSWREVCCRMMKSWTASNVVRYFYWSRDLQSKVACERSTIQHRYGVAKSWATANASAAETVTSDMRNISAASGLVGCDKVDPFDCFVIDLAEGLHPDRLPTGKGAQLLTHVYMHVRDVTGDANLKLSDVNVYAQTHGISVPLENVLGDDLVVEDATAFERHRDEIIQFYQNRFGHPPR
ncbi:hypothetical protein P153DRAFT_358366 [Dothidotthia symphoricarpi CBS 119687]|uniref:Uncharacterized protein n=1 Tax=Dothidotthia symphoricarpi CBS 119687 TaxID=1392245 RepID=A0A6A6A6P0_9PLEO|nr:uncharacterized protein P153DRAFT_358366 [Dothidotthia symphoricarpi CBS 119687]KAF2127480.1 hypothetical protein P153DRAFT_358366 [Dothidotthia symphoricarpi CBS 119687]